MSVESAVFGALKALVANRVFPDIAPDLTARPYITYQQVGGRAVNFLAQGALVQSGSPPVALYPDKANARIQINVWADTRGQASALAKQVEDALRGLTALQTTVDGAPIAVYEADTKLRGTMQDFSFWT
ncbi:MAG: DUF3168 domain-containing protein [Burkholderiales bacterium]|nr:DUF3168 domain-containing protein [Burkholderiales bacterium]